MQVITFDVEGCLSMYTWIALYQNCDLLKSLSCRNWYQSNTVHCTLHNTCKCLNNIIAWRIPVVNHVPYTHSQWMVYTWADITFLLCKYLWPRGHFKGSGRRNEHHIFQPEILCKVIITKDQVNGVCGITCTYIHVQETEKVSKFYNVMYYSCICEVKNQSAQIGL